MTPLNDVSSTTGGVPRWHARYRPAVFGDVAGAGLLLYHRIENLSLGGACVETPAPESVGSRVDVTLNLVDGAAPMRLAARVAWADPGSPGRMGLQWLRLTGAQTRGLESQLARADTHPVSAPGDSRQRPKA